MVARPFDIPRLGYDSPFARVRATTIRHPTITAKATIVPNAWIVSGPNRWYEGCGKYGIMERIICGFSVRPLVTTDPRYLSDARNPGRIEAHLIFVIKGCLETNRFVSRRWEMHTSISCKELGIDCDVVVEGDSGESIIESLMRHVQTEHTDDWFEMEELYQAACSVARVKAA